MHLWTGLFGRLGSGEFRVYDYADLSRSEPSFSSSKELLGLLDWIYPRLQGSVDTPLVLLVFKNIRAFLPCFWSCLKLGIPVLPISLPKSDQELIREAKRLSSFYAGSLLIYDEGGLQLAEAILSESLRRVDSSTSEDCLIKLLSFSELCASPGEIASNDILLDPQKPAYLLETSGTTGIPRAACFNGFSEYSDMADKSVLWLFPISSSSGICGAMALTRVCVFLPLFEAIRSPDKFLQLVEKHKITGVSMPPVLLNALLKYFKSPNAPLTQYDLSSLDRINIGSAVSHAKDLAELEVFLKQWGLRDGVIHTGYGLTETGVLAWGSFNAEHSLLSKPGESLIGPLFQSVEVKLVEDVLHARKQFSYMGYLNQPLCHQGKSLSIDLFASGDDWFDTGDVARLTRSDPPELILCGRAKDILIINSRKLSLQAMEQSLEQEFSQLIELACCIAVPKPDDNANENLILVIAPMEALTRQGELVGEIRIQLLELLNAHLLDSFGILFAALHLLSADEWPRTSTGKVRKAELLKLVREAEDEDKPTVDNSLLATHHSPKKLSASSELEQDLFSWIQINAPVHEALHRGQRLSVFGIDSLSFAGLIGELERRHGPCNLECCPSDPTLADLLALFNVKPSISLQKQLPLDHRNTEQVLIRRSYEQLLRAANIQSSGEPVGHGGLCRVFNQSADGSPVILISAWPETVVNRIVEDLPENPVYNLRLVLDYKSDINHGYLVFCYLEWLESILIHLGKPYILAGSCRGALIALELAKILTERQLQPQLAIMLEWDPKFNKSYVPAYDGAVAFHIPLDHHQRIHEKSKMLLNNLLVHTPSIRGVIFSEFPYNAEGYMPSEHPSNSLVKLVKKLSYLEGR